MACREWDVQRPRRRGTGHPAGVQVESSPLDSGHGRPRRGSRNGATITNGLDGVEQAVETASYRNGARGPAGRVVTRNTFESPVERTGLLVTDGGRPQRGSHVLECAPVVQPPPFPRRRPAIALDGSFSGIMPSRLGLPSRFAPPSPWRHMDPAAACAAAPCARSAHAPRLLHHSLLSPLCGVCCAPACFQALGEARVRTGTVLRRSNFTLKFLSLAGPHS